VVYHYDLVFADEAEQTAWTAVLKALRKAYRDDGATHAARVLRFAREHGLGVTPSPGA
jgi:DNA-binding SARP family transcriptional activator